MTRTYNRSEIISFCELSEKQQAYITDMYYADTEDAENDSYVIFDGSSLDAEGKENEPLPLGMFMRTTNNRFTHGIYSTSAFDGYFITLSKSNDCVVIAHKYF